MSRRSPRVLALWGAAALVAVVTTAIVASDLAALHRRNSDFGREVHAVVVVHDLAVGTSIDVSDVRTRAVHRSQLPAGAVTDVAAVHGRVVVVPVLRGDFVVARDLAPRGRTGLDGALPAGTRAIRVDVADASVARVGTSVDVLASYAGDDGRPAQTVVVAAGALVLGADHHDAGGTGRAGAGVTLLVEVQEAYDLADAQARGVLTIALVPPEESSHATASGSPDRS